MKICRRMCFFWVLVAAVQGMAQTHDPYPGSIDIERMDPAKRAVSQYSLYVQPYNLYYFHHMDQVNAQLDWIHRSGPVFALKESAQPFSAAYHYEGKKYSLEDYFARNYLTGYLVLHDDQILLERYFHGANRASRFLSNSVAKSFTSTLVGAAVAEGKIASIGDPVVKYLPWLKASPGYRDTTIQNLLEMASGVQFDEAYTNPKAEIGRYASALLHGDPSFHDLALSIQGKTKPGTQFEYQTINTQVLGMTVEAATGKHLNEYMEEKIWSKLGMESDAFLFRSKKQAQMCAGGCLNVTVRDYGRFGLMALHGGKLGGQRVVPESWIKAATRPQEKFLEPKPAGPDNDPDFGYGYQWWLLDGKDEEFAALGIYGQTIYVNPRRQVVIVQTAAWPEPDTPDRWDETIAVMQTLARRIQP